MNTELMHLNEDFVAASRAVGKIIISEVYLPFADKVFSLFIFFFYLFLSFFSPFFFLLLFSFLHSFLLTLFLKVIKPSSIGGCAGGEKYIVHNILFKFALDAFGLFGGSDLSASKGKEEEERRRGEEKERGKKQEKEDIFTFIDAIHFNKNTKTKKQIKTHTPPKKKTNQKNKTKKHTK